MTNKLQQALIPLCLGAGNEIYEVPIRRNPERLAKRYRALEGPTTGDGWLMGGSGTLTDPEVTVVLGWLAKARFTFKYHQSKKNHVVALVRHEEEVIAIRKFGDTLNAALAAAVLAL